MYVDTEPTRPGPLAAPALAAAPIWRCLHRRKGGWIPLDEPCRLFTGMVPGAKRFDPARIPRVSAAEVNAKAAGEDRRKPWTNTVERPYRWVCKLQIVTAAAGDPEQLFYSEGTGVLVGDRHVLTAAHCVLHGNVDTGGVTAARAVVVVPGLNGVHAAAKRAMPFGWSWGTAFRTTRGYRDVMCRHGRALAGNDFAVLRLADDLGGRAFPDLAVQRFGRWGDPKWGAHTLLNYKTAGSLRGVHVNVLGYPADKCADRPVGRPVTERELARCPAHRWASVPWVSYGRVVDVDPEGVEYGVMRVDHHLTPGMSGSPAWLRWKGFRNLVGVVHAESTRPGETAAHVIRLTRRALEEVRRWSG